MPYEEIPIEQLILRDRLALDRTRLANERTLLAYVRTAFMLIVAGATAIKALPGDSVAVVSGWALLAVGAVLGAFGGWRFRTTGRRIAEDAASRR